MLAALLKRGGDRRALATTILAALALASLTLAALALASALGSGDVCGPFEGAAAELLGADAYVINLDRHPDRLAFFERRWRESDLSRGPDGRRVSFIRWAATDARDVDWRSFLSAEALGEVEELERTGYRRRHYQVTPGAVGCYLSHWRLWQAALDTPASCVLIMEDDAAVPRDFRARLGCVPPPPPDWDVLLLGRWCPDCRSLGAGTPWLDARRFFGTHCYLVSRRGLRKLSAARDRLFPIDFQIDSAMAALGGAGLLRVYAAPRSLSAQSSAFASSIQKPLARPASAEAWSMR